MLWILPYVIKTACLFLKKHNFELKSVPLPKVATVGLVFHLNRNNNIQWIVGKAMLLKLTKSALGCRVEDLFARLRASLKTVLAGSASRLGPCNNSSLTSTVITSLRSSGRGESLKNLKVFPTSFQTLQPQKWRKSKEIASVFNTAIFMSTVSWQLQGFCFRYNYCAPTTCC